MQIGICPLLVLRLPSVDMSRSFCCFSLHEYGRLHSVPRSNDDSGHSRSLSDDLRSTFDIPGIAEIYIGLLFLLCTLQIESPGERYRRHQQPGNHKPNTEKSTSASSVYPMWDFTGSD